jgi:phosphoglucosamine mutase
VVAIFWLPKYINGEIQMARMFGTDGIRGVANLPPMTPETALLVGRATAYICKSPEKQKPKIVVGNDTRISGRMLESALTAGICSMGADTFLAGALSTPGIAFLARSLHLDAGIMISASHNPYQDNGIKIFSSGGYKLPDSQEDEIERLITSGQMDRARPTGGEIGVVRQIEDAEDRYVDFCKGTFPNGKDLKRVKIVLDCANGATSAVAPRVFAELQAEVIAIHCAPNGTNINDQCGSQHTQDLARQVRAQKADIGLAFDGDGDRLIAVDEMGTELTGDHILAICAKMYKEQDMLKNNLVISTVMSNYGFMGALRKLAIEHAASAVGDRYVLELMKSKGAVIGGEPSGHMIFLNHHTSGDGIISALQVLAAMRSAGKPLSRLAQVMQTSPQIIINVDVKEKPPLDTIPELQEAIRAAESELKEEGRVLIRYSGTQSMCRVMVEGPSEEVTVRLAQSLGEVIKKRLG